MDPRRLVIFHTVIQKGSIGAAARALGWTQPAVSQHLAALEKEVGLQLMLRGTQGVTPTEAGTRLAEHASVIAKQLELAKRDLDELAGLKKGRVRFASFPSAAAMLLPGAIARLHHEAPGVELNFTELEPPEAILGLTQNEVDVAVVFKYPENKLDDELQLEWVSLLTDKVKLVLPKEHQLAHRTDLSMGDLADEEWIAGCVRCREHLITSAANFGYQPNVRYYTDDSTLTQRLVTEAPVIAALPQIALNAYPNELVAELEVAGLAAREIGILTRPGALAVPAIAAFVSALQLEAENYLAKNLDSGTDLSQ